MGPTSRFKLNDKKFKLKLLFTFAIVSLCFLTAINVIVSYYSTVKTVQLSIANQGIEMAKSIAKSIDVTKYKRFLQNPTYNSEYWDIRLQLNDARQKIGALYVYTLKIDNPKVSHDMIAGVPKDTNGFPIDEVCTVPESEVKLAFEGKTYYTGVLTDPVHGNYLSVGSPIVDETGLGIGFLGIDFSIDMLDSIKHKVIQNSISTFIFNVLFVVILISTYSFIQKYYQKATKERLMETEQTYQNEFISILNTVKSIRHDFANHIQVLFGLIKMNHFEKALEYIKSLSSEIKLADISLKVHNPALLVLLQTKWIFVQNKQIEFLCDVSDDSFDEIRSTDLIKILSNLIDNAIEATELLPTGERQVKVSCKRINSLYLMDVTNSGNISEIDKHKLLESGFSTKKMKDGKNRGLGLSIVSNTVKKYSGEIHIESNQNVTSFRVMIPIKNEYLP
jgi:two-component system, LytTR family, sensor histidine kinase AgrC